MLSKQKQKLAFQQINIVALKKKLKLAFKPNYIIAFLKLNS